jgi:signal transduction histidine kinase
VTLVLAGLTRVTARVRCVPLLALGAGVVLEAALSALFALAVIIFRLPLAPELSLFFAFGAALILSATSVFCLLYDTRQFVVGRANLVNIELAQLVSRSRQELGIRQQQLARLVHGSVQSRLNAARLRLSRAQSMTPEVIHAVLADLAEARAELTALPGRYDTDVLSQLEEISDFWHGVCELTLELGPDAVQAMDRDPAASQCVIAVVSEAVNNAVKHALAPEVTVVILCNSEQSLAVEVRNASDRAAGDGSVPGLGSRILNQLTHAWSVTRESGETVLRAEIRLRAPALVPV